VCVSVCVCVRVCVCVCVCVCWSKSLFVWPSTVWASVVWPTVQGSIYFLWVQYLNSCEKGKKDSLHQNMFLWDQVWHRVSLKSEVKKYTKKIRRKIVKITSRLTNIQGTSTSNYCDTLWSNQRLCDWTNDFVIEPTTLWSNQRLCDRTNDFVWSVADARMM